MFQECSSRESRNALVQISFLTPNRNSLLETNKRFAGEFVMSEGFLAVLQEHITCQSQMS